MLLKSLSHIPACDQQSELRMDAGSFAEHLRQIPPARRVFRHPQDRIHEQPIIHSTPAGHSYLLGKVTFDPRPLPIRQLNAGSFRQP